MGGARFAFGGLLGSIMAAMLVGWATPAAADADLFSRETVSGLIDLRLAGADGAKSWTEEGYGKSRYSGAGGAWKVEPQIAEAALVWTPRLSWDLGATVHVQAQPEQEHAVDLVEAFASWRPTPRSQWRYGARAGLFFPPISLEHEDSAWGVTHTITPSAINSWVGEEVKVVGLEGRLTRSLDNGDQVSATLALFGYNDTSGTLLSLRGWALHDLKGGAFGALPLPRLEARYVGIWRGQAPETYPTLELDGRIGAYGRLDWRSGPAAVNLFYYDNAGNRTAVRDGQWSWETRFWNAGASLDLDPRTRLLGQVMTGETLEGYPTPRGLWIDVGFSSAYLLATRSFGPSSLTGRIEWFETVDRTWQDRDDNDEHGWAFTGAFRRELSPHATLRLEAQHIASYRPARRYGGGPPRQRQTVLQSSLKLHF